MDSVKYSGEEEAGNRGSKSKVKREADVKEKTSEFMG